MTDSALQAMIQIYGPYGFGVGSVLLIWYAIVAPFIRQNRVDSLALERIADQQEATVALLAKTADRLETIAARLERLEATK